MTSFLSQTSFLGSAPAQEELDSAAIYVDQSIVADRNYVDLSDQLCVPKHCEYDVYTMADKYLMSTWPLY